MGKQILNGVIYGGGSNHTYSTTEQIVGVWTDGSPVYEKVLTGGFSTALTTDTVIDSTINQNTIALISVEGTWAIGSFGYPNSSQVDITQSCYFYTSNVDVPAPKVRLTSAGLTFIKTNNYSYGFEYRLIIRYTKIVQS